MTILLINFNNNNDNNLGKGTGVKLQGEWGEIVALEGSKSPWEALRATKTLPSIFATFEKASTCANKLFVRRNQ